MSCGSLVFDNLKDCGAARGLGADRRKHFKLEFSAVLEACKVTPAPQLLRPSLAVRSCFGRVQPTGVSLHPEIGGGNCIHPISTPLGLYPCSRVQQGEPAAAATVALT